MRRLICHYIGLKIDLWVFRGVTRGTIPLIILFYITNLSFNTINIFLSTPRHVIVLYIYNKCTFSLQLKSQTDLLRWPSIIRKERMCLTFTVSATIMNTSHTVTHDGLFLFFCLSSQDVKHQRGLLHSEGSILSPLFLLVESSAEKLVPSENHKP